MDEYKDYIDIVTYVIAIASIIVRITPTLKDDNLLLPVIKFLGRWFALNKYGPLSR